MTPETLRLVKIAIALTCVAAFVIGLFIFFMHMQMAKKNADTFESRKVMPNIRYDPSAPIS